LTPFFPHFSHFSAFGKAAEKDRGGCLLPGLWPLVLLGKELSKMVTITFPDREIEKRALAFLLGRFSGRVLRSGEHLVPEAALEALADQNIPFSVKGKATYEQQLAALRGAASAPI
jgi:hypothetical protein